MGAGPGRQLIKFLNVKSFRRKTMFNPVSIRLTADVFGVVLGRWAHTQEAHSVQQAQAECQSIAQQQTGYNPNATATTQPQVGWRSSRRYGRRRQG
jgi:hypothetical protein